MKKFHLTSELLVVAPEFAGVDFKWIDTIKGECPSTGQNETVNVLAFNVKTREEIKPMLENELQRLLSLETPQEIDTHNMAYIQRILNEIEGGGYAHNVPDALLETIGKCARRRFSQDDVIYLSGVSAITD